MNKLPGHDKHGFADIDCRLKSLESASDMLEYSNTNAIQVSRKKSETVTNPMKQYQSNFMSSKLLESQMSQHKGLVFVLSIISYNISNKYFWIGQLLMRLPSRERKVMNLDNIIFKKSHTGIWLFYLMPISNGF